MINSLEDLEITTSASKTAYIDGDSFEPTGMVVTATYSNGSSRNVTSLCSIPSSPLSAGDTSVDISYTFRGVTLHVYQSVTVSEAPTPSSSLQGLLEAQPFTLYKTISSYDYKIVLDFANGTLDVYRVSTGGSFSTKYYDQTFVCSYDEANVLFSFTTVTAPANISGVLMDATVRLLANKGTSVSVSSGSLVSFSVDLCNKSGTTTQTFTYTA